MKVFCDIMSNPSDGLFTVLCECGVEFPAENNQCSCGKHIGELKLNIDEMLNKIYLLSEKNEADDALDIVFDVYWNLHNMFPIMNDILSKIDISKLNGSILVGFMAQTFKYIDQVPNHLPFCDRAAARMTEMGYDDQRIHNLVDPYRKTGTYWQDMKTLGAPEWLSGPKPKD